MSILHRRLIFFALILAFLGYSGMVYVHGTGPESESLEVHAGIQRGKLLFQEYNCVACHQLYGLGGYMGPDLTNVISATGKGKEYAGAFLRHGTNRMPNFHLQEQEIRDLISFLEYVDRTGISPPRNAEIEMDGSLKLPPGK